MMPSTRNIDFIPQSKLSKKRWNRPLMWKSRNCGFLRACFVNNIQTFCVLWEILFLIYLRQFMEDLNSQNQILHHLQTCLVTGNTWWTFFYIIFLILWVPSRKKARKWVTLIFLSTHYCRWTQDTYFHKLEQLECIEICKRCKNLRQIWPAEVACDPKGEQDGTHLFYSP